MAEVGSEIKPLTAKEELFCQSYLIDFNGARAAREAGYSEDSAKEIASQNLTKIHIQTRIQQLRAEMGKNFNITRERLAQELARIAFADIRKLYNVDGSMLQVNMVDDDTAAAIAGTEVLEEYEGRGEDRINIGQTSKVKLWEKTKAIEALAKLMGYNAPTRNEITGADGVALQPPVINISVVKPEDETGGKYRDETPAPKHNLG